MCTCAQHNKTPTYRPNADKHEICKPLCEIVNYSFQRLEPKPTSFQNPLLVLLQYSIQMTNCSIVYD